MTASTATLLGADGCAQSPKPTVPASSIWVMLITKLVNAVVVQSVYVFAPFLADAADLSLADYRWSLVAIELAGFVPTLLPLDRGSPCALGIGMQAMLAATLALSFVLRGLYPLVALRFVASCAFNIVQVAYQAVLSAVEEEKRTQAIAFVELSWTLASFVVPVVGSMIGAWGVDTSYYVVAACVALTCPMNCLLPRSVAAEPASAAEPPREDAKHSIANPQGEGLEPVCDGSSLQTSIVFRMSGCFVWMFLLGVAQNMWMTRYGDWLHGDLGMSASMMGWFSNAIALGNLGGNLLTQCSGNTRIPERTFAVASSGGVAAVLTLLAVVTFFLSSGFAFHAGIFVAVVLLFLFFECAILMVFSYALQLCKHEPMRGMALVFATMAAGRVLGAYVATWPPSMADVDGVASLLALLAAISLAALPRRR